MTRIPFPFAKVESSAWGGQTYYRWKIGIRWDEEGSEDRLALADGVGAMLIVEVGRYTPPGFGPRVFSTHV